MPYTWLIRLPGLSGFREANRFALLALLGAALLAGAAVDWLRYHARPLIIVVVVAGLLEAGSSGSPGVTTMTAATPAVDRQIAADHSGSIVVDVPFGLRGGLGIYGPGELPAQAFIEATDDGHPRAISYTSWLPAPTIAAFRSHLFFRGLMAAQYGRRNSPARLAAARLDARRMGIGWVLIWSAQRRALIRYLGSTGFRFAFLADGVVVYRPAG